MLLLGDAQAALTDGALPFGKGLKMGLILACFRRRT